MHFDPMTPIWVQVTTRLKQQIVTGVLAPGAKLPGGRDLASEYGINPNTAARIYQEMEREGLCETRRGLGTFVTEDTQAVSRLRSDHPDFSEDDIRLCMLSRLKLSNTALSAIYVISISAVQHRKQRLKRNGFGVTDSNISFDQVIANF